MHADVLIVNPPSPDGHIYIRDVCRWGRKSREGILWPQTSLAYIAAMVPGHLRVEIIDAIAERMPWEAFEQQVRRRSPRVYVSYVAGPTFAIDARGIGLAKSLGALTVAVGVHPSAVPKDTLESIPELDVVIRHEPELTFRDVLERFEQGRGLEGCAGTAIRGADGSAVIHPDRPLVENLDELPIPLQHLLPLDRYRMPFIGSRYVWLLTNRGCPYRCTYCFESVVWGKSVRYRSAESISKEVEYLARHGVHKVVFLADLFTYDRKGVMRLCDLLIEKGIRLKWACNSRVDTIDEEMARRMKQAGCWLVALGIESGSQAVLDACRKDAKVEQAAVTVRMLDRAGIRTWGYFIIGLPGETERTIEQTIEFACGIPLDIALFHVAVPYAGTDFYFQAIANGWLTTADWTRFDMNDSAVVQYDGLPAERILEGTRRALRRFYFRPRQAWRILRMMAGSGDIGMLWDIGKGLGAWMWRRGRSGGRAGADHALVRASADTAPCGELGCDVSLGRGPVVEMPREDMAAGKPSHRSYRSVLGAQAGGTAGSQGSAGNAPAPGGNGAKA